MLTEIASIPARTSSSAYSECTEGAWPQIEVCRPSARAAGMRCCRWATTAGSRSSNVPVTVGVGHGKTAARHVDAWLRAATAPAPPEPDPATFEHLTTWDYADAPRTVRPQLDRIRRQTTFNAVIKLEPGAPYAYAIDLGFCKGCGLCVAECPFCAIEMVSEDI